MIIEKTVIVIVLIMLIVFASEKHSSADPVRRLSWLDNAIAKNQFGKDIASVDYKFFAVQGFAVTIPHVGRIDYEICFKKYAKIEIIEGTSDNIISEEHLRLDSLARDYANEYNILMQDYLMREGLTECRSEERWGKAFSDLNNYIWGPSQNEGILSMSYNQVSINFLIRLRDKSRAEEISLKACECFKNNGILRRVNFTIEESFFNGSKWQRTDIGKFSCENGNRMNKDLK